MGMKKHLYLISAALAVSGAIRAETICSGQGPSVAVNLQTGVRTTDGGREMVIYDASWYEGGATVRVDGMGAIPLMGTNGTAEWTPTLCRHHLTLEAFNASEIVVGREFADFSLADGAHCGPETNSAVAPTCTEVGRTAAFTCLRCSEVFPSQQISPLGHFGVITKPEVEPAFGVEGLTAEIACVRCGAILQAQTSIAALAPVRNVTARQLWPHKKVEVCFDVGSDIGSNAFSTDMVLSASSSYGLLLPEPVLSSTGAYAWTKDSSVYKTGDYSWKSGNAGKANSSSEITTTVSGATKVSFYWKVSSQLNYDKLHFYVDGSEKTTAISGTKDWTLVSVALDSSSSHTLKWSFTKNGSGNSGQDCGWIDGLELTGKSITAAAVLGDESCTHGHHVLAWDLEADGIVIDSTNVMFTVGFGTESAGSVTGVPVDTSSLHDGMNVSGAMELGYSPFEGGEATIRIDGETAVSSADSGVFLWQPQTIGLHTLQHVSGTNTWTRTVSVTSLAFEEEEEPAPPADEDENISLSSTSRHFAQGGGSASIVTSGSGTWTAASSASWITIPASLSSRNAGMPVVYQVAASDRAEPRTGCIYVSGHVFTVTQDGVGAALDATSADFGPAGGTGSFTVLAGAQANWQVRSNVDWISVERTSGTGEATVSFTVAPFHAVSTRSGTITAAGCTFTVNQTGRSLSLSATDASYTALGLTADRDYTAHVVAIVVTALADAEWGVEVDASWLSVADAGSGRGGGTVAVAANENPSWLARTGTVRIGTETLVVRQAGRPPGPGTLSFDISPAETTASVKGANGLVAVAATPDLPWSAESRVTGSP